MLIEKDYNLTTVFTTVKHEIRRATLDKRHPFRYVVLGTEAAPVAMRYVVLRKVDDSLNLTLYTDHRSGKIHQLNAEPRAQLLFYHPGKKVQVMINGTAILHHQDSLALQHWQNVQGDARKAYASTLAPGTSIKQPKDAYMWNSPMTAEHFTVIQFEPTRVEVLQLNGLEHLRAFFSKESSWNGTWVVP